MHRVRTLDIAARDREVIALDRPVDALVDGHRDPDMVEDAKRILGAVVDRDVAVDRRRRDQIELGMECREHQRDGIVGAGVDVEDDLLGHERECTEHGTAECSGGPAPTLLRPWV